MASKLREGVTTGTCAAAVAKAAAVFFMTGECPAQVRVTGPTGREFTLDTFRLKKTESVAAVIEYGTSFGVVKDAGEDIDITDGLTVCAKLDVSDEEGPVTFVAGSGVGTVTLPGLKIPVGEPAINPGPRIMIERAMRETLGDRAVRVTISIINGEEVAKKTFNPRLGIVGGLSILGTTGVVKPMNEASLLESLDLELNMMYELGVRDLIITFGGTGETAVRKAFDLTGRCVIQASNYPGHVIDTAHSMGFRQALIAGHPGKLLKVAAGSFLTHNRVADGRLEVLCTHAALAGASREIIQRLYGSRTTGNAIEIVQNENLPGLWTTLAETVAQRCTNRSFGEFPMAAAFVDNNGTILGESGCTDAKTSVSAENFRGIHAPK